MVWGMKYVSSIFPILKHLPDALAPWKREINENGKRFVGFAIRRLETVEKELAQDKQSASVPHSLTKHLIERREAAFRNTTVGMLCTLVLALVTNPSVQRTAQAEIDAVVGSSRSTTFEDYPNLPYTRALIHEALRWRPVSILGGAPHASTAPSSFGLWHIPRGTPVIGNVWAINNNEAYFPDPQRCDPTRFLSETMALRHSGDSRARAQLGKPHTSTAHGHSALGWGRRICPGSELAPNTLFIGVAKMLWAFDLLPREGHSYDTMAYTDGFNMRPRRFECDIKVRSEKHREVLLAEEQEAREVLKQFPAFD